MSSDEPDLLFFAVTAPKLGASISRLTKSPLVASWYLPAATDTAPVLRPLNVMVNAVPAGIAATAVVMVILLPENAELAVRAAMEEVPAEFAVGAAVVSYQPDGNQKLIVPPIDTADVAVNANTSVVDAVASVVAEGTAVKSVTGVPRPPESTLGEGAISVSV